MQHCRKIHLMKNEENEGTPKPSRSMELEDYTKAMLNILQDFMDEKSRLESSQRAMLNILEDFSDEKSWLESTQRAMLNLLEDFNMEREKAESINVELRDAERKIKKSMLEKDVLLKEIQHSRDILDLRVKERTAQISEINKSLLQEIEERKYIESKLLAARKKLRAMTSEIVLADERSRQRFATDLHDTVVQTMAAVKLRSQLIQDKIPKDVNTTYSEMQDFIAQSITQARTIMSEMGPPVLYELGFIPALEWLTEHTGTQHNLPIVFKSKGKPLLKHEVQVLLFQATRELLNNILKHAHAKRVVVRISATGSNVTLEVKDNGKGFDQRRAFHTDVNGGGFGLFSIRERLRHFDGNLSICSKSGQGTKVTMTVPRISP